MIFKFLSLLKNRAGKQPIWVKSYAKKKKKRKKFNEVNQCVYTCGNLGGWHVVIIGDETE